MRKRHEVTVTVTSRELMRLAECGDRMTDYCDPDGSRLITVFCGQDGTAVRLVLDRRSILDNWQRFGPSKILKRKIFTLAQKQIRRCSFVRNREIKSKAKGVGSPGSKAV